MEDRHASLPMGIARQIDAICDRFEEAWLGNQRPHIEDCLTDVDEAHRSTLLRELLRVELECRIRSEDAPAVEDYRRRFPEDGELVELLFRQVRRNVESLHETQDKGQFRECLASGETAAQSSSDPGTQCVPRRLGNCEVLEEIGRGGMGRVYKARHLHLGSLVAVKVLAPHAANSPEALARFRREARSVARLRHPNIVIAHDADEERGTPFLVLEYVEGVDLASLVKRDGPRPVAEALDYVIQAAEGFEYAHSQGMVHRDIKPSNLLVDSAKKIKILDLGLAAFNCTVTDQSTNWTDLTGRNVVMGTVDYMSPEQGVDARQADHRSDIYGLGCTLYFLLTGKRMFSGRTFMERLLGHRERPIPSICSLREDVPRELERVFFRMVAKKPADRFQSMSEVAASLQSIADGFGAGRGKRRYGLLLAGLCGALLLAMAVYLASDAGLIPSPSSPSAKDRAGTKASVNGKQRLPRTADNALALSVLRLGGTLLASLDGEKHPIEQESDIPESRFEIRGIDFTDSRQLTEERLVELLPDLNHIEYLILAKTEVGGDCLRQITSLTQLEGLNLESARINDVDLIHLQRLTELHSLWLVNTPVGDAGLGYLEDMSTLRYLWLGGTEVTDSGMHRIAKLTHLQGLGLEKTKVTSEGLRRLANVPLKELWLHETRIGDDDTPMLACFKTLQVLGIEDTSITESGVAKLQIALPNCDIRR